MQFVNRADHGREFQSASSFDGFGECLNPTEAGSLADTASSTSVLLGISASGNMLNTTTQMAYWTPAGYPYPQGCGGNPAVTVAQNPANLSSDLLTKRVSIGYSGIQNVIEYLTTFHVSQAHQSATFESLTGYMPANFSLFLAYDPSSTSLARLPANVPDGEQVYPLIFSTEDHRYAIGVYSPDLPQVQFPTIGYGHFALGGSGTQKWNSVFRAAPVGAGDYAFRNYLVVGNLQQVVDGMAAVNQIFHPTSPTGFTLVHRFHSVSSGDYLFTLSQPEGIAAGYDPEGVGFKLFPSNSGLPNSVSLYRCISNKGSHFISSSSSCEGSRSEGMYGYAYASQVSGSSPLYRFVKPSSGIHFETTNYAEGANNGYTYEGVLGYVP
jgi:hypothetical protein